MCGYDQGTATCKQIGDFVAPAADGRPSVGARCWLLFRLRILRRPVTSMFGQLLVAMVTDGTSLVFCNCLDVSVVLAVHEHFTFD